jgi:hypothetical protein
VRTRSRRTLPLVLALVLVAIAVPASADHFSDVASGHAHHRGIADVSASGITAGCATNPDRYCAERSVTRGQMATFLSRGLPRAFVDSSTTTLSGGNGVAATVRVDSAADTGGTTNVVLQGSVSVYADAPVPACPCEVQAYVLRDRDDARGPASFATLVGDARSVALPVTWAVPMASGGSEQYHVAVFVEGAGGATLRADASLTATTAPLGRVPAP